MRRALFAALGASVLLGAAVPVRAQSSAEYRRAIADLKAQIAKTQTQRESDQAASQDQIKKLQDETAGLQSREDALQKEIDADPDETHADLQETKNVLDATLFKRQFELKQAQRNDREVVQPLLQSLDEKLAVMKAKLPVLEEELAQEIEAEKRAAAAALARKAKAKKAKTEKAKALAEMKAALVVPDVQPSSSTAPSVVASTAPPAYEPKPPRALHCPAPPTAVPASAKPAFSKAWNSSCWFSFDVKSGNVNLPEALRIAAALLDRQAKKTAAPTAADTSTAAGAAPPAADTSTAAGAADAAPIVTPEQVAAKAMGGASFSCFAGILPFAAREFGVEVYDLYDRAGKGLLPTPVVQSAMGQLSDAMTEDIGVGLWARDMEGCEPWAGSFWEDAPPAETAAYDEWAADIFLTTEELRDRTAKLESTNPQDPKLRVYDRIMDEREKTQAPSAPAAVPAPKSPAVTPTARPAAAPAPVPAGP